MFYHAELKYRSFKMKVKIKKGEKFSFSQRGHKGFFYPSEKTSSILHDTDGERLPWVGSEKAALSVPESAVLLLGDSDKKTVVWI
jgi:hypothetical protein